MADASEELPPLVQELIARYDPALSQPQFDKMSRGQQDAVRDINKSLERLAKSAAMRQARILADEMRKQNEAIRKSYQQREQLALGAGKREGEIVKATSREVVAARRKGNTQELDVQRKATSALVDTQRKGMARWEETVKRSYFRMKGTYRKAHKERAEDQARANREEQRDQQRANRQSQQQQDRAFKVWFAAFNDFLMRRRAAEREAGFDRLAAQKAADRKQWQQQKSADSLMLAEQKAMLRQQVLDHQAATAKSVNAHKAMWSIIRTTTETGGRFMSSITQSFLRSMGTGVARGLGHITSIFRREGNEQEAALRSTYAQQEQITRRALVRQQGIVQGFQTRNAAITQGGAGGGPVGAIMSIRNMLLGAGAFISARAIFGPIMDYQQTKIAFEGILQSGTAAQAMLDELQEFAKVTPFTFAGIADSARSLLAVGYAAEDVIPMMTTLGNTAAGLGLGEDAISGVIRALGQMKGKGKASAEELQQISEQLPGFSAIEAIASSMGITVAEAFDEMKAGAIPADQAITAILEGMERMPGAAGAMERQSKTLAGRLSTLKDTVEILLIKAMDPFIESISNAVGMFTTFLDNLFNAGGVFAVARSAILGLALAFGSMLAYQGVLLLLDGIRIALWAIATSPVIVVFTGLVVAMTMLYRHVPAVTDVVNDLRDAFVNFFKQTRQALGLLMDGDFPAFFDRMQSIGEDLLAALAPSATVIRDFFMDAFDRASEWIEGGGIGELRDSIVASVTSAVDQVSNSAAVEWMVDFGKESFQKWQAWLDSGGAGDLAESIGGRISSAFSALSDVLSDVDWDRVLGPALAVAGVAVAGLVLGWPVAIGGALIAGIIALSPRLRDGLTQLFERAQEWISDAFDRIDWMKVGTTILEGLRRFGEFLGGPVVGAIFSETGLKIMGAIAIGIVAGAGAIALGFFQGLSQSSPKIDEAIGNILDELLDKLRDWIRGLDGIWGALAQTIIGPFQFIFGVISDGFDALGEVLEGWRDIVTGIFAGDWGQVFDGFKHVWWALFQFLSDVVSRFLTWAYDSFSRLGSTLWGAAVGGLTWVKDRFFAWGVAVINFWSSIPRTMADAFTGFGGLVMDAIKAGFGAATGFAASIVNSIIDLVNREVIDRISGITIDPPGPGPTFNVPDLPHIPHVELAKGGIVTKPTVALIGEAGPEAVVPLSDGMGKIPLSVMFDTSAIAGQVAGVAALLAPMGERISEATMPGLRSWAAEVGQLLDNMSTDFKDWGKAMVVTATIIGTSIASAMTSALREGRREVVRIVRGYGRSLASALNPLLEAIGEQPVTMEFAKGGIVEAREGAQVHVFNEGRRGRGSSHGEAYIPFDPANKPRSQALAAETVRRLGGDVQWYAKGGLSPEAIRRGQSFARAQDGKPYVWGGVGPNGYDCSGLASAIVNAVRGEDPYRRLFTSGSLVAGASAGLLPGLGQVSVGARSGSPGHVSSTIAGLNAESTGDHVRIGAAARSAADFPSRWHLGSGVYIGPNGTVYPLPEIPEVGRGELGRLGSGWMRYVKDRAQRFVDENTYTGTAFGGPESGVPSGMMVGDGSPEVFAAIRRAMGIVGVPSSWLGPLLTLIGRESSFNPRAYNSILGASGLMQTIPSTFAAYHLDPWNNIFGPTDNVIAGLRYIIGRYGSIFNVGQAMSPTPTRGYSYGGVVDREGLYRLAEGNRREMVLPLENPSRTSALLRRLGVDTGPTDEMVRPARANVEMGSVIGVMNVNTNAADPETVATITTNKIDQRVRQIMAGV